MHTVSALRINHLFHELLTDQFPERPRPLRLGASLAGPGSLPWASGPGAHPWAVGPGLAPIRMRYPSDFAEALLIHVNHLNRILKGVTGKTTSELIAERLAEQSCLLLSHSHYTCSEISFMLGFGELPHFINFFKRKRGMTPNAYRRISLHAQPDCAGAVA
jgi:AraC-like DNA-binding protein